MAVDTNLFSRVKTYLRISHDKLDAEIVDGITACRQDLSIRGIRDPSPADSQEPDPLILNAIKLYCKAEYTDDPARAADFRARYESLRACLQMAEGYGWVDEGAAE